MNDKSRHLTNGNHASMDVFLNNLFDAFLSGSITKEKCTGALAHIIGAVDSGNVNEAAHYFHNGESIADLKSFINEH